MARYLEDHAHSYRLRVWREDQEHFYRGPYGTVGAAKGQLKQLLNRGHFDYGWIERTTGAWEKVEA